MKNVYLGFAGFALAVGLLTLGLSVGGRVEASPSGDGFSHTGDDCQDRDGDGYGLGCSLGTDCNDSDATIHPGQIERCNFLDDDCNALVDDEADCDVQPIDPSLVRIPKGRFLMGSEEGARDERPTHQVVVSGVSIDRYEVTNKRYAACVTKGACTPPLLSTSRLRKQYYGNPQFSDYPVIFVNWSQANTFCRHDGGRLPTEAEWEKAARGDGMEMRTYPWGEDEPSCALTNFGGQSGCVGDTDRIGRRPQGHSPFGAMDMAGNVWEWVDDWYGSTYYEVSPLSDPKGPETGRLKVMRGGCWQSGADSLRVSCRKAELPAAWAPNVGFRCVYPKEV